jgi:hypothetical protein
LLLPALPYHRHLQTWHRCLRAASPQQLLLFVKVLRAWLQLLLPLSLAAAALLHGASSPSQQQQQLLLLLLHQLLQLHAQALLMPAAAAQMLPHVPHQLQHLAAAPAAAGTAATWLAAGPSCC